MKEPQEEVYATFRRLGFEYDHTDHDGNIVVQKWQYIGDARFKHGPACKIAKTGKITEVPNE
jgi:hypothetical protein